MERKSIPILIITILCIQSIIVVSSFNQWTMTDSNDTNLTKQTVLSQGSRLDPEDYSNSVPIIIEDISDFDLWDIPGEGTPENPYMISAINITAPIAYDSIKVANIDAYVTIVDCFLRQGSGEYGIYLVNTSHITIEYVTIESIGGGIYCLNANNTQISHCQVISDVDAVCIDNSNDCHLYGNYLEGTFATCNVIGSTAFVSENNVYQGSVVGSSLILVMANDSRSTSDYFDTPTTSVTVSLSANFIISDAKITGVFGGLIIDSSDSPIVTRCTISTEDNPGLGALNCPNFLVNESIISSLTGDGIYVDSSNYTQILDNTVTHTGYMGIAVLDSFQSIVARNVVDGGYSSIYLMGCEQSLCTLNEVTGGVIGAGMEWCNNSAITFNFAYDIGMVAFVSSKNFNISVNDNIVNNATRGGIVANVEDYGYGLEVCRNEFSNIKWWAISADDYEHVVIKNNSISVLEGEILWPDEGQGIRLKECDDIEIEGNNIWDGIVGIATASCVDMTIKSNIVEDMIISGIAGVNNVNTNVTDNIVEKCGGNGISLGMFVHSGQAYRGPPSGEISRNNLSECGFQIDFDSFSQYDAHTYDENMVNSKAFYYVVNESSMTIDADLYGQVALFNCSDLTVTSGGYIFNNALTHVLCSSEILVKDLCSRSIYTSLFVDLSQNITIGNYTGEYLEGDERAEHWGFNSVVVRDSTDIQIENSVLIGNGDNTGFSILDSTFTTVESCDIFDMLIGIMFDSENCTFLNNNITKTWKGIYTSHIGGHGVSIINNEIRHASVYGIHILNYDANRGQIQGNTIESCETGIRIEHGTNWTIQNNMIRWNAEYGIYLDFAQGVNISYNSLGFSGIANGYDDLAQNWDDNVSLGNYWYDYTPPGAYPISGGAGAQDRYPMQYIITEPIIDQLLDIYYPEGSTGNEVTWHPVDDELRDWQVTIDGVLWDSAAWNFENVTTVIDGLPYGQHTLVIIVWDVNENNVTDTLTINVFDGTNPTINHLPNSEAFVEATGQTLIWQVSDNHPNDYILYIDDTEVESGEWISGSLEVNIDGQDEGIHDVRMVVRDIDGNEANDTIQVVYISDTTTPILDSPDDITIDYGTIGSNIIWTPEDGYPSYYDISLNGTSLTTNDWSGSRISLSLDGLEAGTYNFELTVYDGAGLSASDTVMVQVLQITGTHTSTVPPLDLDMILIAGVVSGAIAIVVVAAFLIKKRKSV